MSTAEVFSIYEQKAKALPFIRITKRTRDSIAVQIDSEHGRGKIRLYALFPDIFLGFNEFSASSFPSYGGEVADGIKINFCVDGRCEVKMSDGKYLFLEAGDLSLDARTTADKFTFPYDRFWGLKSLFTGRP
jgi:hypothetical protein